MESSVVMISEFILVIRIYIVAADFPEERMELVVQTVFSHLPDDLDLVDIRLEVAPYIVMDRDDDLAVESFRHTKNVCALHLVLDAYRVQTESRGSDIDVVVLAVFREVDGIMGIAGMIDVAAGCLDQEVNSLLIHIQRAFAVKLFTVSACGVCGNKDGPVKSVQSYDLKIFDLNAVAGLNNDTLLARNAPAYPDVDALRGTDERCGNGLALIGCMARTPAMLAI